MQTRKRSLVEAAVNIAIGYCINLGGQLVIFPVVGVEATMGDHLGIGLFFTLLSLIRQYVIRRYFNRKDSHVWNQKT